MAGSEQATRAVAETDSKAHLAIILELVVGQRMCLGAAPVEVESLSRP